MVMAVLVTPNHLIDKQITTHCLRCMRFVYSLCNAVYILYTPNITDVICIPAHLLHSSNTSIQNKHLNNEINFTRSFLLTSHVQRS